MFVVSVTRQAEALFRLFPSCPQFLMSFSFKLDGSPVSSEVSSSSLSRVSFNCVRRLGLSLSGGSANVAVSVKIGDSWATCIISLLTSHEHQETDVVLGGDWQAQMKDLCSATGFVFPVALVNVCLRL